MNDVKLYPIYNNDIDIIKNFDKQFNKDDIPSPNSFNKCDELYQLDFMFFNKVKNSLIYNNNEELFNIIYTRFTIYNASYLVIFGNTLLKCNIIIHKYIF